MERRLAAILAADVVGYSRLMEQDEAGTFARLRAHRKDLFEPEIAAHHGRVFKLMGDGLLAEFASVVDAVECAVSLQTGMAERNAATPAEHRIEWRIGINLGDVIVEKDDAGAVDMHGEGVIISNRLQALAEPRGICVSQTVVSHVGHKIAVGFEFVGDQRVKNVAEPVRVYRVLTELEAVGRTVGIRRTSWQKWRWPAAAAALVVVIVGAIAWQRPWQPRIDAASIENMALPLPDKPSIAVLPFTNMSDDPKQEYFADGLTDGLITQLSQVSGLFVISRNSTFIYKGRNISPKQVSEELGIRYVLEGSVQRASDHLRINAQLIDALSGGHLWAGKFDGSLSDVFALQDKVTRSIADALEVKLTNTEHVALGREETSVPAAYDAFIQGWEHYRRTTPDDYAKAVPYFEEAIRLDPNYARAHAALAMIYLVSDDRDWWTALGIPPAEGPGRTARHLQLAAKHPTSTYYQAKAVYYRTAGYTSVNIDDLKLAIALDPSDSWSYAYVAWALVDMGQPAEGTFYIKTAIRLDPHYPPIFLYILGLVQLAQAQFADAAASLEHATSLNPEDEYPFLALAATYGHLGRKTDALAAIARYNDIRIRRGDVPLTVATAPSVSFSKYGSIPLVKKGLRLAGVPETFQNSEFVAKNQLTAGEIRALFFGHRFHGQAFESGNEREAVFAANGTAMLAGDWGELENATVTFAGDEICFEAAGGVRFCASILRNPGGSSLRENEYIWLDGTGAYPFSSAK